MPSKGSACLYFLEGYYSAFGTTGPNPIEQFAGIVTSAVLYAWVYNRTRRSVLAVVLLHFMENFAGQLLHPSAAADRYELLVLILLAAAVVARWGPRRRASQGEGGPLQARGRRRIRAGGSSRSADQGWCTANCKLAQMFGPRRPYGPSGAPA